MMAIFLFQIIQMQKNKTTNPKIGRKFRLKLTKKQVALFEHHCETTRLLFNALLEYRRRVWTWCENKHGALKPQGAWKPEKEIRNSFYAEWREHCSFFSDCKQITAALQEYPEFATHARQLPRLTLNIVAESLDNAWQEWMKGKKGAPKFKAKGRGGSFTIQLSGNETDVVNPALQSIRLGGKLGVVRFRDDFYVKNGIRDVVNPRPKRITIVQNNRKGWYAAVLFDCESRSRTITPKQDIAVGIDVGIAPHFLVTSTNERIAAPRNLENALEQLAKLQRKFARQLRISNPECFNADGAPIRGKRMTISKRAEKTRMQIAKLHAKVTRKREHFLYDTANHLTKEYNGFYVEDMPIAQMMQEGGKHPAIGKFSRGIADASWGKFLQVLEVRATITGREFQRVPPQYTSRTCCYCGHEVGTPVTVRSWTCPSCKKTHYRKHNAAKNIAERATED